MADVRVENRGFIVALKAPRHPERRQGPTTSREFGTEVLVVLLSVMLLRNVSVNWWKNESKSRTLPAGVSG
jgi:hypothetical protein